MLPSFLQSSYERYKGDTNSFATWLLDAATKCGYKPQLSTSDAKKAKKGRDTSSRESKYQTTIQELRNLSQTIVQSTIEVPKPILALARRAIKLRKDVTSWFMAQGDSSSNERHAHFISTMEGICDSLEWKQAKYSKKPDAKPADTSSEDTEL